MAIAGATSATYTLLSADVGARLNAVVTATNTAGSASATSAAAATVTSAAGPLTAVLDNFNRANNSGPPSANWSAMPSFNSPLTNNLFITANQVTGPSGESADYWNAQQFAANSEAYVTVAAKPTVNLDPVCIGIRYQSPDLTTSSGYRAMFANVTTGADQYKIYYQPTGGSGGTVLSSITGPELNPGDQILFRAIGPTLELWRGTAGTWTKILTATSTAITTGGYATLIERNSTVRLDDFGGGTLP